MSDRIGDADACGPVAQATPCIGTSETTQCKLKQGVADMNMKFFRWLELRQKLDTLIAHERQRRMPDAFRLLRLQRLRLALKSRLTIPNRAPQMA